MFCSDVHGDEQDKRAVNSLLAFCEAYKPHVRVFGGDLWDFRPLRRKACDEEKRESMVHDFTMGVDFLKRYQPQFLLRGNHDERLWDLSKEDRGIISDYAIRAVSDVEKIVQNLHCRMLPYHKRDGVLKLGSLKMIHGFLAGVTAARRTALAYGSVLMGHGHAVDHAIIEGLEPRMGRMAGCLCKLDMDYNRAQIGSLRHAHGFIYGCWNEKTGDYFCQQSQRIGNLWTHDLITL